MRPLGDARSVPSGEHLAQDVGDAITRTVVCLPELPESSADGTGVSRDPALEEAGHLGRLEARARRKAEVSEEVRELLAVCVSEDRLRERETDVGEVPVGEGRGEAAVPLEELEPGVKGAPEPL